MFIKSAVSGKIQEDTDFVVYSWFYNFFKHQGEAGHDVAYL
jgi:hypothetical protein